MSSSAGALCDEPADGPGGAEACSLRAGRPSPRWPGRGLLEGGCRGPVAGATAPVVQQAPGSGPDKEGQRGQQDEGGAVDRGLEQGVGAGVAAEVPEAPGVPAPGRRAGVAIE